jgi:nucleoside phosphorylase
VIDAVFVPRGAEERAVRAGLSRRSLWRKSPRPEVAVYTMGIGSSSATAAAEVVIASGVPRRVLVTGLCGSLDERFRPGDALLYVSIEDSDGIPLGTDKDLTEAVQRAVPWALSGIRALSVGHIVTKASEKRALAQRRGCHAVDMESLALLARLHRAGASVAILRVVSDGVDTDLPDLNSAIDAAGNLDGKTLARVCLFNPLAALRMALSATAGLGGLRSSLNSIRC